MRTIFLASFLALFPFASLASEKYWVNTDRLNRRTCPSTNCGIVGQFFYREGLIVYEKKNGWARVSNYYDASCHNGVSEYVDAGENQCSVANGIDGGKFAEWVSLALLVTSRPADPGAEATGTAKAISGSDDYRIHKSAFVTATDKLIKSGRCVLDDFKQNGGWIKSTKDRNRPVYFTYCGKPNRANRIYLDASTGRIFQ